MSIDVDILYKDGSIHKKRNAACLYYLRCQEYRKILAKTEHFEVFKNDIEGINELDKKYHNLLMNSFIKDYIIPDRPLVARFSPRDSWGLIFLITSSIRLAWEYAGQTQNIIDWYETGKYSADEALILGSIAKASNPLRKYSGRLASNHGYIDNSTPIKGLISRLKNLLELVKEEPGVEKQIIDFKHRVNYDNFGETIQSLRQPVKGYAVSCGLNKSIDEIHKIINEPTKIEEELKI